MSNFEKQFGLFDNNLEGYDDAFKKAFSEALEIDDVRKEIESGKRLGNDFIFKVIGKLTEAGMINFKNKGQNEDELYPRIKNDIQEMLDFLDIKHSFEKNKEKSNKKNMDASTDSNSLQGKPVVSDRNLISGMEAYEKWENENNK